jgi:hypothetical protein
LNSVQWSRRFLGLRLFLVLAAAGWEGVAAHVERSVAVIAGVERRLIEHGWRVVNDSRLAVLDVLPPAGFADPRSIARRVVASGRVWVACTEFEGRDVVRICATHGQCGEDDIDELVAALTALGRAD